MEPLNGYDSVDKSFLVQDYPYGGLRCRIRFWLERNDKKGFRFCSQTENPKRLVWNAVKKSTYSRLAGAMYLDDKGHCHWDSLTEYDSVEKVRDFIQKYPGVDLSILKPWCAQKAKFCQGRADGKIVFTINGEVQPDSSEKQIRLNAEAIEWQALFVKISEKINGF